MKQDCLFCTLTTDIYLRRIHAKGCHGERLERQAFEAEEAKIARLNYTSELADHYRDED